MNCTDKKIFFTSLPLYDKIVIQKQSQIAGEQFFDLNRYVVKSSIDNIMLIFKQRADASPLKLKYD
jgi:hypothetical protein